MLLHISLAGSANLAWVQPPTECVDLRGVTPLAWDVGYGPDFVVATTFIFASVQDTGPVNRQARSLLTSNSSGTFMTSLATRTAVLG